MSEYKPFEMYVILLSEDDCIRTSFNGKDYDDNELPLVPFIQQ